MMIFILALLCLPIVIDWLCRQADAENEFTLYFNVWANRNSRYLGEALKCIYKSFIPPNLYVAGETYKAPSESFKEGLSDD